MSGKSEWNKLIDAQNIYNDIYFAALIFVTTLNLAIYQAHNMPRIFAVTLTMPKNV